MTYIVLIETAPCSQTMHTLLEFFHGARRFVGVPRLLRADRAEIRACPIALDVAGDRLQLRDAARARGPVRRS